MKPIIEPDYQEAWDWMQANNVKKWLKDRRREAKVIEE